MGTDNFQPLNEYITLQRGFDLPASDRLEGEVPVVAATGVAGQHSEAKVKAPGVVIGRSGSIGGGQFISKDFWPLNTTLWVKDFKGHNERFVYYLLKNTDFSIFNVGSGVPTLNRNHLSSVSVKLRSRSDEDVIAHILGTLDDKIELNRQMNETLEAIAQALFKSWFVDFGPVIDNALAAGNEIPEPLQARVEKRQALGDQRKPLAPEIQSLFPDRFVFTDEMGWVPEGWEVKLVGDVLELAYGKSLPATKRIDGKFPVYGSGGVSGYHNECLVKGPGVVVGRKGTVGSLYWAEQDFFPIDTVFYVVNKSSAPLYWLYQTLALHDIKSMGADSAVPGVNRNAVYNKTMVIPSSEILDEYLASLGPINARRSELTSQSKTLADLRDALLPKLLSGELRIPDVEKQVAEAL
jgi:type I restriction enzyme S subunit